MSFFENNRVFALALFLSSIALITNTSFGSTTRYTQSQSQQRMQKKASKNQNAKIQAEGIVKNPKQNF